MKTRKEAGKGRGERVNKRKGRGEGGGNEVEG
jgi:hypothetical protein